jgi:IS5 family transposase
VDVSIISAPGTAKNRGQARNPDMHQTKTGNQCYFGMGMILHIGTDSMTRLVHSAMARTAIVHGLFQPGGGNARGWALLTRN